MGDKAVENDCSNRGSQEVDGEGCRFEEVAEDMRLSHSWKEGREAINSGCQMKGKST